MKEDKYIVTYNGKPVSRLNERLAKKQGVTDEQLTQLRLLHEVKHEVFRLMTLTSDPEQLKNGANLVEQLEFALQRNWNFPEDRGMHEWYDVPGCTCPKMDNADNRYPGSEMRIHMMDCPIHGE